MENKIFAYKRKVLGDFKDNFNFEASNSKELYNHSCVVKKKELTKTQIKVLKEFRNKRLILLKKESDFIKGLLK